MKEFGWGIKDKLDASHFVVFLARKKGRYHFRLRLHQAYAERRPPGT
mgnify:CR=1 FL=1